MSNKQPSGDRAFTKKEWQVLMLAGALFWGGLGGALGVLLAIGKWSPLPLIVACCCVAAIGWIIGKQVERGKFRNRADDASRQGERENE
jgi:hypothetical protein